MKNDSNFEENLSFQSWHEKFDKFWSEHLKSSKIFTLMSSFWAKYRGINLSFQNWHKEFDKLWPEHSKVSKIFTLMASIWAKYILFELKKYRGVIFHETEEGYKIWRGIDLFLNCHKEFDKFWHDHSKV